MLNDIFKNDVLESLWRTNICTFNLNCPKFVDVDGEIYIAYSISTYNLETIIDGKYVIVNGSFFDYEKIDYIIDEEIEVKELFLLVNKDKALFYNNETGEIIGQITKILDDRTINERLRDL